MFRNQSYEFANIGPINDGTMVSFVNNFFYDLIDQMISFADYVETRVITLNRKIQTCQENLLILEMKLKSIDGLEVDDEEEIKPEIADQVKISNVEEPQITAFLAKNEDHIEMPVIEKITETTTTMDKTAEVKTTETTQVDAETADAATEPPAGEVEEREDLIKFRKMLKFGIPPVAVRQKMMMEGVDPSLLNI